MKSWLSRLAALAVLASFATGCSMGAPAMSSAGGEFGATQGGVKDMKVARELVANGQVPPPESLIVEGMFSEHDLPVAGAPCSKTLCLRGAMGIAPTLSGESSGWVQIGMSSTINPDTYQRPSLTVVLTADISGSMGWDYSNSTAEYGTPGAVSRKLMKAVAAQLGPQDRVALVAYGTTSQVVLGLTPGGDPAVEKAIDSLSSGGSTNMEDGLKDAFSIAVAAKGKGGGALASSFATDEVRVMLFTDVQPNVGVSDAQGFESMTRDAANQGVGLTVFALGLGIGQQVLDAMAHLRGGNAFSLFKPADVDTLMADSWPWFACPLAYDLEVTLSAAQGFSIMEGYGFPNAQGSVTSKLSVSSVFLSRRKGAMLVRLASDPAGQSMAGLRASGNLSYTTPAGEAVTEPIELAYDGTALDSRGQYFAQASTSKTVALAIMVSQLRRAAEIYGTQRDEAVKVATAVVERISADAAALADPALGPEVKLASDILELMKKGAPQGNLYGAGQR